MNQSPYQSGHYLPPVMRPQGPAFFFGTWSGRILILNTIVFLLMAFASGNIFMPSDAVLMLSGIKEPVALVHGEYWRLVTPMFVHIGLIHFAMNSFMLYIIGYQLEYVTGGKWYLVIYLGSGVFGNIASAVFSVFPSAGASGAIFGLLGCGFFIERSIGRIVRERTGRKPRQGVYTMTILLNVVLGLMIPFIDNAAHLGGLVAGAGLTYAMFCLRPNRLQQVNALRGKSIIALFVAFAAVGSYLATSKSFIGGRMESNADATEQFHKAGRLYSNAIEINPERTILFCKRGRLNLMQTERFEYKMLAYQDLRVCMGDAANKPWLEKLIAELKSAGLQEEAVELEKMDQWQILP